MKMRHTFITLNELNLNIQISSWLFLTDLWRLQQLIQFQLLKCNFSHLAVSRYNKSVRYLYYGGSDVALWSGLCVCRQVIACQPDIVITRAAFSDDLTTPAECLYRHRPKIMWENNLHSYTLSLPVSPSVSLLSSVASCQLKLTERCRWCQLASLLILRGLTFLFICVMSDSVWRERLYGEVCRVADPHINPEYLQGDQLLLAVTLMSAAFTATHEGVQMYFLKNR